MTVLVGERRVNDCHRCPLPKCATVFMGESTYVLATHEALYGMTTDTSAHKHRELLNTRVPAQVVFYVQSRKARSESSGPLAGI